MATVINGNTGIDKVQDDAINPVTDIASGIPCFSASYVGSATLPANTATKLVISSEEFDTTNSYNNITGIYTPNVAGYYQVILRIQTYSATAHSSYPSLYRNGVFVNDGSGLQATSNYVGYSITKIVYMNGTSDYIESYLTSTVSNPSIASSYFQAHLIVGA